VSEVEDYARVNAATQSRAALAGSAVTDVIHLLAELVENATSFSPPETPVQIGGQRVANGFVVEIEDRGLGMPEADLAKANEQLRDPPEFRLSGSVRLGLYVVGRLAQRHGIRVELRASPYGGTLAIVLIPMTVIEDSAAASHVLGPARRAATADGGELTTGEPAGSPRRLAANLLVPGARPQARKAADVLALAPARPPTPASPPMSAGPPIPAGPPAQRRPADPAAAPGPSGELPPTASGGLPRRVRQPNTAPPFPDPESPIDDAAPRAPEETLRMLANYQQETARGRSAAEQTEAGRDDEDVDTGTGNTLVDRQEEDDPWHRRPVPS
jgi:hypothetical protein